jgi:hypothetical protein
MSNEDKDLPSEQFSALLTEVKNTFDILKSNLSMSGTHYTSANTGKEQPS